MRAKKYKPKEDAPFVCSSLQYFRGEKEIDNTKERKNKTKHEE